MFCHIYQWKKWNQQSTCQPWCWHHCYLQHSNCYLCCFASWCGFGVCNDGNLEAGVSFIITLLLVIMLISVSNVSLLCCHCSCNKLLPVWLLLLFLLLLHHYPAFLSSGPGSSGPPPSTMFALQGDMSQSLLASRSWNLCGGHCWCVHLKGMILLKYYVSSYLATFQLILVQTSLS